MLSLIKVLRAFFKFTPLNISSQSFENLEPRIPDDMSGFDQIFERGEGSPYKGDDVYSFIMKEHNVKSKDVEEDIAYLTDQYHRILLGLRTLCNTAKQTQIPDEIEGKIALIFFNLYFKELYQLLKFIEDEEELNSDKVFILTQGEKT